MAMLRRAATTLNKIINLKVASTNCNSFASPTVAPCRIVNSQLVLVTYRFYSSEIDLFDVESRRRTMNRLLYRSKQRGFLELDLVLGKWVEDNIHLMDENKIKSLMEVLNLENPDLWNWLSGQEQPPESVSVNPVFTAIREKVSSNLNSRVAPETRASPGKPWVRGWDDIKRGKDTPVSGNQ